jgi:hypothetical protein
MNVITREQLIKYISEYDMEVKGNTWINENSGYYPASL